MSQAVLQDLRHSRLDWRREPSGSLRLLWINLGVVVSLVSRLLFTGTALLLVHLWYGLLPAALAISLTLHGSMVA